MSVPDDDRFDRPPTAGERPPAGNRRRRWTAAASVLGALLVTALVWRVAVADDACAAVRTAAATSGKATFYELAGDIGNCSTTPPADDLYVALGDSQYDAAAACGGYLDVTGPKGTVRVKVVDRCPECEPGHLDVSRTAFTKIADPVDGIVPVRYRQVTDPRGQGRLSFRVKEGSSQFWLAILVDGAGNPVREVEVRSGGGGFTSLAREDFGYWIAEGGAGGGPFDVRVTDSRGHRVTAEGVDLRPGAVQRTPARLYGAGSAATSVREDDGERRKKPKPSATSATPTRTPPATPEATATAAASDEPAEPAAPAPTAIEGDPSATLRCAEAPIGNSGG